MTIVTSSFSKRVFLVSAFFVENAKAFSNSSGLRSVLVKLCFRDGLSVLGRPSRRNKAAFSRSYLKPVQHNINNNNIIAFKTQGNGVSMQQRLFLSLHYVIFIGIVSWLFSCACLGDCKHQYHWPPWIPGSFDCFYEHEVFDARKGLWAIQFTCLASSWTDSLTGVFFFSGFSRWVWFHGS